MSIVQKIIEFFKKIGILKAGVTKSTYTSSKDEGYQPPDPTDH